MYCMCLMQLSPVVPIHIILNRRQKQMSGSVHIISTGCSALVISGLCVPDVASEYGLDLGCGTGHIMDQKKTNLYGLSRLIDKMILNR